jgi:hypothetical protein
MTRRDVCPVSLCNDCWQFSVPTLSYCYVYTRQECKSEVITPAVSISAGVIIRTATPMTRRHKKYGDKQFQDSISERLS